MTQEFKNILSVRGDLMNGDVQIIIEEGVTLDDGRSISESKKYAISFSDVLKTPVTQATPPLEDVRIDPDNPLAHFVNGVDATGGIKQVQPITPQNQAEKLAERLAMLADLIGSDSRPYAQIKAAWAVLIREKNIQRFFKK